MADDIQSKAAEMMKKVLTIGVGAIFLTEESLRALVGDFKVPKELLGGILESAAKTKNEFLQNLSRDVMSRVSDKIDPRALIDEFFARNEIDIHVRVAFKQRGERSDPSEKHAHVEKHLKKHSHAPHSGGHSSSSSEDTESS